MGMGHRNMKRKMNEKGKRNTEKKNQGKMNNISRGGSRFDIALDIVTFSCFIYFGTSIEGG